MTKEQLLELGLSEEQIAEVFKLNGIAVNNAKGDIATKETDLADTKKLLVEANSTIKGFKDMNIDDIKLKADDYKTKFETAEAKSKEDIENLKFNHDLESMARDYNAKNIKAVLALLDKETLKGSSNRDNDLKTAFEGLNTSDGYLFGSDEANGTGGSLGAGNKGKKTMTKESIMAIENSIDRKQKIAENIELFK